MTGVPRTIVIRGCVTPADANHSGTNRSMLVWTKGDVMLTDVATERTAAQTPNGQPGAAVGHAQLDLDEIAANVATQDDIVSLMQDGRKVIELKEEQLSLLGGE